MATLSSSSTEIGQGSATALAQIVAGELGIELFQVAVGQSDTRFTPFEWSTGASRTTTLAGTGGARACADIWAQLDGDGRRGRGVVAAETVARDGAHIVVAEREPMATWPRSSRPGSALPPGRSSGVASCATKAATAQLPPFWEIGVVGVEVAVDEASGAVSIEHLVTVGDVGHAINPALVEGQDLGAATRGSARPSSKR